MKLKSAKKTKTEPKKIAGRQRRTWPVIESIRQVVAELHYTAEEIKLAQKSGSKAFITNGRIDTGILIPDLNDLLHQASELPEGFTSWKEFGESRRAKIADVELKEKKQELMSRGEAKRFNAEAWAFVFSELERFCVEKPPALAGRSAVEIFEQLNSFKESMRKSAKDKFEKSA